MRTQIETSLRVSHPAIWSTAATRCQFMHDRRPTLASPACHECLTAARAADAAAAAESELDTADLDHDPFLVDEVAIGRALAGERVILSPYEWHVVVRLLSARLSRGQIIHRLQFGGVRVADSLSRFVHPADREAAVPSIPSGHVEDLVVEARMAGSSVRLTPCELNVACRRLAERGLSKKAIARRLDVCDRTVAKALRSRRSNVLSAPVVAIGRPAAPAPAVASPLLDAA